MGLETVELKGEGFTSFVKVGDKVTKGQLIVEVDLEYIEKMQLVNLLC
ncbi:PTS glucose transporter subunit IIA [Clostridium puniceum]|nr:PTS glucose transporter subunit IIA [Clostridium puniceum]